MPFRVPLPKIHSTMAGLEHQRWLEHHRQRTEAARQRYSRRPTHWAGQQSEDESTSANAADPEPPARLPTVRGLRRRRQPSPRTAGVGPLLQPPINPRELCLRPVVPVDSRKSIKLRPYHPRHLLRKNVGSCLRPSSSNENPYAPSSSTLTPVLTKKRRRRAQDPGAERFLFLSR